MDYKVQYGGYMISSDTIVHCESWSGNLNFLYSHVLHYVSPDSLAPCATLVARFQHATYANVPSPEVSVSSVDPIGLPNDDLRVLDICFVFFPLALQQMLHRLSVGRYNNIEIGSKNNINQQFNNEETVNFLFRKCRYGERSMPNDTQYTTYRVPLECSLNEWLKRGLIELIYPRSARADYRIGLQAKFP